MNKNITPALETISARALPDERVYLETAYKQFDDEEIGFGRFVALLAVRALTQNKKQAESVEPVTSSAPSFGPEDRARLERIDQSFGALADLIDNVTYNALEKLFAHQTELEELRMHVNQLRTRLGMSLD